MRKKVLRRDKIDVGHAHATIKYKSNRVIICRDKLMLQVTCLFFYWL